MTGNRKAPPEADLIVVDLELSERQVALVDSLAECTSTPRHEVTRSDVLRIIMDEGLEHIERGLAQLAEQSAKPPASA
jgi:hypothetical protein